MSALIGINYCYFQEKVGHLQGAERAAAICTLLGKVNKPDPNAKVEPAPNAAGPGTQGPSLIDPTAHATSAFMKGERVTASSGTCLLHLLQVKASQGSNNPNILGKGLAAQIAAGINAKKNFTKANEEDLLVNPTVVPPAKVEEEIEINDLPQQARLATYGLPHRIHLIQYLTSTYPRYRITSKDAIASIQEYSECALTVRGTYYPPNKNPPEGMRKVGNLEYFLKLLLLFCYFLK